MCFSMLEKPRVIASTSGLLTSASGLPPCILSAPGVTIFLIMVLSSASSERGAPRAGRSCGATAFAATNSLAWNDRLFAAAESHSSDMARNNYFSHTSLDGRSASSRVTAAGYVWRATGENIAAGQRDVTTVMNGWLASEGHCRNIMNPSYQDVAVACVQQTGSTYGRYWTMVLARP